jgi:hypothetical protein
LLRVGISLEFSVIGDRGNRTCSSSFRSLFPLGAWQCGPQSAGPLQSERFADCEPHGNDSDYPRPLWRLDRFGFVTDALAVAEEDWRAPAASKVVQRRDHEPIRRA